MRYLTIVYQIPDDFDVSTLTSHKHARHLSKSNTFDELQNALVMAEKWKALAEANARGFEICQQRQERTDRLAADAA